MVGNLPGGTADDHQTQMVDPLHGNTPNHQMAVDLLHGNTVEVVAKAHLTLAAHTLVALLTVPMDLVVVVVVAEAPLIMAPRRFLADTNHGYPGLTRLPSQP